MTLTYQVKILPGYDNRDSDGAAEGCLLSLVARGPLGAIAAEINTGWMSRPLATHGVRRGQRQARRDRPGVDQSLTELFPRGYYVGAHSLVPREGYQDRRAECELIGGAPCWNDGSFTAGDRVLEALVSGGSDSAFAVLAEFYQAWLVGRPEIERGAA